ncbi:MAG TPA: addiction module protein [Novimethylophilus sp.]|jgi:hypothetical protein|uniref:addiction module protein n=1 Tax=Novimethylophilus sp. TaxID=2137426 RepID=UPI002F4025CF
MSALAQLTRSEKLRMMEALWDDLAHDITPFPSPEWHGDALNEAEHARTSGQADFIDWETAKKALRDGKA